MKAPALDAIMELHEIKTGLAASWLDLPSVLVESLEYYADGKMYAEAHK